MVCVTRSTRYAAAANDLGEVFDLAGAEQFVDAVREGEEA